MLRRLYHSLTEHLPLFATLSIKDHLVILAYFLLLFGVAFYFSRRKKTPTEYFLAGRNTGWIVIGASLFATSISGVHVIGLSAMGSTSGVVVGYFELLACLMALLLGWIFAPFYLKSGVFTMPEFLARRFNSSSGWIMSLVSIALYLLTTLSFSLYAGGIFLKAVVGIDMTTSAIIIISAVGLSTVLGGLTASLHTHFLQAGVLVLSSFALTWKTLKGSGGWSSLVANTPAEFWSIFKPMSDPDFPWTGILFGAPIIGIWYWCMDQYVVQRVLSAKNIDRARRGTILAGFLTMLPLFLLVLPGIIAMRTSNGYITGDRTYGWLVLTFLPSGWRGLAIAGVLAAMMSSMSAVLNSASTLLTIDVFKRLRPKVDDTTLVRFGQVASLAIAGLALLWIPFLHILNNQQVYMLLLSIQAYIAPPIAAVFLFGLFWHRVNEKGAIVSLLTGFVLSAFRFFTEFTSKSGLLQSELLNSFATINFLHYAIVLFLVCSAVLLGVSLMTQPQDRSQLRYLTMAESRDIFKETKNPLLDRLASIVLLVIVLAVLFIFR